MVIYRHIGNGQIGKCPLHCPRDFWMQYNIGVNKKTMKALLNFYLASALSVTTVATGACFVWYVQEYDAAYKYHKVSPEVSQIHRNNSLWLGLWGGIYGLTGVASAIGLSQGIKKDK
jgi:hypothetical protein